MDRRLFLLSLPGLSGCTRSRRPRLNVYNWSNYVAPDTISNFERETGVEVRYSVYESNEEMLSKVLSGNSGWDVVFPSNSYIGPMRQYGLLAPLEHDWLSNLSALDAGFQSPPWDPGLRWCVPYMWGSTGIVYNQSLAPAPAAWGDLWNPRLRGRLTMLDDPADVLGACLKKLHLSINATDPAQIRQAQAEAVRQKPLLRAYLNAEVRDQLVAGDVLCAQLWATTAQQAIDGSAALRFDYPAEGFALYADCAVVLAESRRRRLAHRFLNFLLRPRVAAAIVAASRTACANGAARALLPREIAGNPTLFPPPEILARGEWIAPMPPAVQRLRDRVWTEIKSA